MTFCDLTIYNDNPLLIRLCTELNLLPNFEWFPWSICDGCGMPTGDAYSSRHLVPSLWDLHMFYLLRPILFRTCRYFTGLCSSNIPRYFLDFASHNSVQVQVRVTFLVGKNSRLIWTTGVSDFSLLEHNLKRDNTFDKIMWQGCG